MKEFNRLALLAGLASVALIGAACGPPETTPDGGTDGGPVDETCVDDTDCPDPDLFFCNTTTSTCQPACRAKADCTAEVRGEFALTECEGNLGCQCDEGACVAALCSADADCGGKVCRNGACVDAPAAATAQSCQITPDYAFVKAGETAQFWVSFWDASNNPVVLKDGITWTAVGDRVNNVTGAGDSATVTGNTPGAVADAVQVSAGGATCVAKVVTLDATVPNGEIRVTTVNELTGRPVTGGHILVSNAADGTEVDLQPMDASGTTLLNLPASGNVTVSAFHTDYGYMTVANYAQAGSRDLLIALRRNQADQYGGYKGTFTDAPQTSNVHAGLAGMSIAGSVVDLSVTQLLGHTVPTDVKIGSAIEEQDVPLPAGAYLGFSDTNIKTDISAQGLAGVCTSALSGVANVEQAIANGECGTRTAWALAGDVPLGDLPIDAFAGGLDNINFGSVLSRIIPIFKRFNSSIVRDVQFRLQDTPGVATGDPNFSDTSFFTDANHDFDQIPLGFSFAVDVPTLPQFKGDYADGVILLGGADVKGRGVVPLGLGAGVNTATTGSNSLVDQQAELPKEGLVLMRMAPTHHGIEGAQYAIVGLAVSLQSVNDASAGLAVSALLERVADNKLAFDPSGSSPLQLEGTFPNYPENGKYNFTDDPQPGLAARTFKFVSGQDLSSMSVVRVQFSDLADHRWLVVTDPATAAAGVVIPKPPMTYADRTFYTGSTTGERSPLLVQAIRLADGGSAVNFNQFVQFNGTNMDRLGDFMVAFSAIDFGRPEISWETPSAGAMTPTIAPGSTIVLNVSGFKVGTTAADDGVVKITFNGGTGCTEQTISTDASMGAGELSHQLPAACTGANVEMTATLFNNQGTAIAPGVSNSITVNIQ